MDVIDVQIKLSSAKIKKTSLAALERAIKIAGNPNRLATHCGMAPQMIHNWRRGTTKFGVGAKFVLIIEKVTGVQRHDLRMDLYPNDK